MRRAVTDDLDGLDDEDLGDLDYVPPTPRCLSSTTAEPGSKEKIGVLMERARARLALHHPEDRRHERGLTVLRQVLRLQVRKKHGLVLQTRKRLFRELVALQDKGLDTIVAREEVAKRHDLTTSEVEAIEEEGLAKDWPLTEEEVEARKQAREEAPDEQ